MDTIETLILELIDTIKTLAPEVFAILIKKQLTDGIIYLVIGVILFIVCCIVVKLIFDSDDLVMLAFPILGFVISAAFFFTGLSVAINPEYYAIKNLISLLTGRP